MPGHRPLCIAVLNAIRDLSLAYRKLDKVLRSLRDLRKAEQLILKTVMYKASDVNHCDPLIISFSDLSLLCLTPALPPALSCLVLLYLGFRRLRCGKKKKPSPFDCPITTTHTPLPTAPPTRHLQDSRCQPLVNHQPRHH